MDSVLNALLLLLLISTVLDFCLAKNYWPNFYYRKTSRGHKFYDEREYDDGYAEYTGAEKRAFSEMQRRKLLLQEDQELEKRETVEDWLRRELKKEYSTHQKPVEKTQFEGGGSFVPESLTSKDAARKELSNNLLREENEVDKDEMSLLGNQGTRKDELALKKEEAKLRKEETQRKKDFSFLPRDGDLFEGDMVMDQRLRDMVTGQNSKRDAIKDEEYLWPEKRVPYILSEEILSDQTKRERIDQAIAEFHKYTCIRYVEREEGDEDYVKFIINGTLCYSSVGKQGYRQDISIGNGCERLGTVIHEMMHTIGFVHEHSRPDRDDYVWVLEDNIKAGLEHNFQKYSNNEVKTLEVNQNFYDYDSCLHYSNDAFSRNGKDTIQSKTDPDRRFGQREGFSRHDIMQINELYACPMDEDKNLLLEDVPYV